MEAALKYRSAARFTRLGKVVRLLEKGLQDASKETFRASIASNDAEEKLRALSCERIFEIAINDLVFLAHNGAEVLADNEAQYYEGGRSRPRHPSAAGDVRVLARAGMIERDLAEHLNELIALRNKLQHDYAAVKALEDYHYRISELPVVVRAFAKGYLSWLQTERLTPRNEAPRRRESERPRPHLSPINPQARRSLLPAQVVIHLDEVREALVTLRASLDISGEWADLGGERAFEIAVNDLVELVREGLELLGQEISFINAPKEVREFSALGGIPREMVADLLDWVSLRNKLQHDYPRVEKQPEEIKRAASRLVSRAPALLTAYRDFLTTQIELPQPNLADYGETTRVGEQTGISLDDC